MRQQGAQSLGCQLIAGNDAGRTAALKVLVAVLILFAAGKRNDLCRNIGAELLLACAVLNHHILIHLAVFKAHKLQRDDIGSLVQQLVEGMLSVCAGFAENHRPGGISETVYRFAVGFHVKLL